MRKIETKEKELEKNKKRSYKRVISQIVRILVLIAVVAVLIYLGIIVKTTKRVKYDESNNIAYKVYLKENQFYDEKFLSENMQYVASLIDYIEVDFSSLFNIDEVSNIDYKYSVKGTLNIADANNNGKILFSKDEVLLEEKTNKVENNKSFNISEKIKVKYQNYNNLAQSFKSTYRVNTNSTLDLELKVEFQAKPDSFNNNFTDSYTSNISIPLDSLTINVESDTKDNNFSTSKTEVSSSALSYVLYVLAACILLFTLALLPGTIKVVKSDIWYTKPYEAYINTILREYDRAITEIKGTYDFDGFVIFDVKSFEALIGIYDSINQPIICIRDNTKENQRETIFFIKNNNDIYRFIVNEENFINN